MANNSYDFAMNTASYIFTALLCFLLLSCGRKIKESESQSSRSNQTQRDGRQRDVKVPEDVQSSEKLICKDKGSCPEHIVKVVVRNKLQNSSCLGVLLDNQRVLTSASCFPKSMRITGLDCSKSTFIILNDSLLAQKAAGCDIVEYSDNNAFIDPALWYSDFTILRLGQKLNVRPVHTLDPREIKDSSLVTWGISKGSVLEKKYCKNQLNTYLNPFSVHDNSSTYVMSHCDLSDSDVGAPVFSGDSLAGIYSAKMSTSLYQSLKGSGVIQGTISQYYHVSNTKCLQFNNNLPVECFSKKSTALLDKGRSDILKSVNAHNDHMDFIEDEFEKRKDPFKWKVFFEYGDRLQSVKMRLSRPRCIYNSSSWISRYTTWRRRIYTSAVYNLEIPDYKLQIKLDDNLKPVSVLDSSEVKKYNIKFNPYSAHIEKKTDVTISFEGDKEEENLISVTYKGITDHCL